MFFEKKNPMMHVKIQNNTLQMLTNSELPKLFLVRTKIASVSVSKQATTREMISKFFVLFSSISC